KLGELAPGFVPSRVIGQQITHGAQAGAQRGKPLRGLLADDGPERVGQLRHLVTPAVAVPSTSWTAGMYRRLLRGPAGRLPEVARNDRVGYPLSSGSAQPPHVLPDSHSLERSGASVCDVGGKGPGFGNNISHSHRRTPRRWNPNIQRVRVMVGATPKRLNVCTSCIKAGKVTR